MPCMRELSLWVQTSEGLLGGDKIVHVNTSNLDELSAQAEATASGGTVGWSSADRWSLEPTTYRCTQLGPDDDALTRAQEVLGTSTKKDTVNAALAQVIALHARRQLLAEARDGAFTDAADEDVMDRAWR